MAASTDTTDISVLVVEDEPVTSRLLTTVIASADGLGVVGTAGDGRQAVSAYAELRPQVVTLDLGLPDEQGLVVLRRLRQINPEVRVVVVSGLTDAQSRADAFEAGACSYVDKPIDPQLLIEFIREAVAWPQATSLYGWDVIREPAGCAPSADAPGVLVVDDERVVRRLLSSAVNVAGCRAVGPAASLAEAEALLVAHEPSLILLDVAMRDGEGLHWLAWQQQERSLPPVLVVSAFAEREVVQRALALGVAGYLTKPVSQGRVATALRHILGLPAPGA